MAKAAAFEDPRFPAVNITELPDIDIEISVLTPMKRIHSIDKFQLGKQGIYMRKGNRAGTFLPQVADEVSWTKEEFLGHCAQDKAGIGWEGWRTAELYTYEIEEGKDGGKSLKVRCELCPHRCVIPDGKHGICGSRWNFKGKLYSIVYGKPCALADDPVEKKPLNEFHPGTRCLSLSCTGCNFRCLNCQNYDISQALPSDVNFYELSPHEIVDIAMQHHLPGIAFTYTEPLTYYEYIHDIAKVSHEYGLWNILVSAGYINPEPLQELLPYIDAANIDIKAFSDTMYMHQCGGHLKPVLDNLLAMQKSDVHLEITNLLIPGVNDSEKMIRKMCRWLVSNGFAQNPLHFSRFFPLYKMQDASPTPKETIYLAKRVALEEGMKFIYLGNI